AFEQRVGAFWLHPFGDLCKSVETGYQSSLQTICETSTAGNRFIAYKANPKLGRDSIGANQNGARKHHFCNLLTPLN
ncbi:hypothetical protein, partial [Limnohabitans sp.]|uniref:hypothetical protein n=1 Tax=Limnohabitans sp. TaxID=1907725 RepID=UPI0037C16BA5